MANKMSMLTTTTIFSQLPLNDIWSVNHFHSQKWFKIDSWKVAIRYARISIKGKNKGLTLIQNVLVFNLKNQYTFFNSILLVFYK